MYPYDMLQESFEKSLVREQHATYWIKPVTCAIVDHRARLRREGELSRCLSKKLDWNIAAGFRANGSERARRVSKRMIALLKQGKVKEVWCSIRGWYGVASATAPGPYYLTMDKQTADRDDVYTKVYPLGIPSHAIFNPRTSTTAPHVMKH